MLSSRERNVLIATAAVAIGVPTAAVAFVDHQTDALASRLGTAAGVPAKIGAVDADLTGTVRLSDVALGSLVSAESIEASVALESLLDGQLGADEIRVAGPKVALEVDRNGDSDLARVIRKLAKSGGSHHGGGHARVRRIVVSSGTLTARIAGIADLSADDVELVPDEHGVRVITGHLRVHGELGSLRGELDLARSAAEVDLPHVHFGRVLAVGGTGTLFVAGEKAIALRDVAVGRLGANGSLEARAALDDGGALRQLAVSLDPAFGVTLRGDKIPLRPFASLAPHALVLGTGRASGQLTVRRSGDTIRLSVDGSVDGIKLDHKALAGEPVPLSASVKGSLTLSPDAIALDRATLDVGAIHTEASGWWRRGTPASGQIDLKLAQASCTDLLASLPAEMRGPLDGMTMTGTLAGHAHLAIDLAAPDGSGVDLSGELANECVVTNEPPAADVGALAGVVEHSFPDGSRARVGKGEPQWYELRRLPPFVPNAFVSAEDGRFWDHHGFDLTQIGKSLEIDLRNRRIARGGSTISQQLIKNAFLTQRRSFDRKLQEAVLTWRLEQRLDKKAILERYLNVIELGPHVFGLRAAAQHWFDRSPHELNVHQAAFLAALTCEPESMSRRIRHAGGLDADSAAHIDVILRAMRRDGVIDNEQLDTARETQLHFAQTALRAD
jgi:hypothetical protein